MTSTKATPTLVGSPEPPSPYTVERVYPDLPLKSPIYIAPEPGTGSMWVVLQGGDKDKPSRIERFEARPDVHATQPVFEQLFIGSAAPVPFKRNHSGAANIPKMLARGFE